LTGSVIAPPQPQPPPQPPPQPQPPLHPHTGRRADAAFDIDALDMPARDVV
jgi:hypothetical protein